MNCLRQTFPSFYDWKVQCTDLHVLNSYSQSSHKDHYTTTNMLRVMIDFCDRTAITHILKTRKGLEDYRMGSDSTAWATELWFYWHVYCCGRKIPFSCCRFPLPHLTTISKWHSSFKTSQEEVCHLSRFTLTLTSRQSVAASKGQTLLSELPIDSMVRGWRGADFFQPKLQCTVQELGSLWTAHLKSCPSIP